MTTPFQPGDTARKIKTLIVQGDRIGDLIHSCRSGSAAPCPACEIDSLRSMLVQVEKDLAQARETNTLLNRRLTKAEGALAERIEDAERKGHSLGRSLANAGYYGLKERIASLEAELARSSSDSEAKP